MAGNKTLDLTIRIAGKMDKSLLSAINGTQNRVSELARSVSSVGTIGLASMGTLATGTVAAIASCTKEATTFENQMADVVKYVDGLADASGKISGKVWSVEEGGNGQTYAQNYAAMKDAILDLSTQIPYTAEDLTRLAAAAGQSGKSMDEITGGFLKDAAMWGTAMDISADQAGDWAAKWEMAFDMNHDQIMTLADQINYLGANNATTAAEIAQMVNDAASLGQVAGVDPASTAAVGTAMLAMGVDAGRVGTSVKRIYTNISKGSSATKAMKEQWMELGFTAEGVAKSMQEDGVGTMQKIFQAIDQLPQERQVAALSTLFGQWAIEGGAKIVGNLGYYAQVMESIKDPANYTGSMEREFIIKAETPEALKMMRDAAWSQFKIGFGESFLPVQKELDLAMRDLFVRLHENMPQLTQLGGTLAELASGGIQKLGDALEAALPYVQRALDYVANNGPQVTKILGGMAGTFAAMKFAPGITGLLGGAGNLLLGAKSGQGNYSTRKGGLAGMVSGLWSGGRNAAARAQTAVSFARDAAGMARASEMSGISGGIAGLFGAVKNMSGLMSGSKKGTGAAIDDMNSIIASVTKNGLLGAVKNSFARSGIGKYFGGVRSSLGNLGKTKIGSGILGGVKATGGVTGEILKEISNATGLTGLVKNGLGIAKSGADWVTSKAGGLAQGSMGLAGRMANSAPGQFIGGALGNVGSFINAGAGALGSIWGPMASGFGGLLSGALPIVGVVSSIVALVSILYDNLDGVRSIIGSVFGEKGLVVFDNFENKLVSVKGFIARLFEDGGVAKAVEPLKKTLFGTFDIFTESYQGGLLSNLFSSDTVTMGAAAFDGLVQIAQSVMGVVGQVVTFANTTVKPIITKIFGFITQTVVPILLQTFTAAAPIISGIIGNLGSTIMTVAQIIGTAIQIAMPIVGGLITAFLNIGSTVIPVVLGAFEIFSGGIAGIVGAVQTILGGMVSFITGVFTLNWTQAWQGVRDIFGGIFEGLGALVKTPLNAVISVVNKAISGINGLGLTIPDWVPVIGGKSFSINIPEMPMLAKGGFTNGPSIAGEAGMEAVISFQKGVRSQNINTWLRAGEMLGVGNRPVELPSFPKGAGGNRGFSVNFAPHIEIKGNADKGMVDQALAESEQRFEAWLEANFERLYERMERERSRMEY